MNINAQDINYVVNVNKRDNEVVSVLVKFKTGETYDLPVDKARELANMGQLYGFIDYEFIPCLKFGNLDIPEFYLKGNKLYKADSVSIYNECNNRLDSECAFYTIKDYYVICYKDKSFVVKSNVIGAGFVLNDVRSFKLEDGRLYIVVQGLGTFNYGIVQAAYNELMYVTEEGVYCIYHSSKSRMEEIVKYYKPVDINSTDVRDIRQKIANAIIENELNKFDITCRENVIFIGNIAINMGGNK